MNRLLLYGTLLGLGLQTGRLEAQITITAGDMPSPVDTLRYRTAATATGLDETGPDHAWDYSALEPGAEGADTIVTVGSTPLLYQFFFNNGFLYPDYNADFAMRGPSIGLQGFTIDNVFDYYKADKAGYRDVGFGAAINSLPTSVQRTPIDWIYRFPMAFGNTDSSASAFQINVPTLGTYGQSQMRHNEVDGWGTLYLPADTFQVLRVKSIINRTDTVYIDQFDLGFSIPEPETVEYKWLAQGMGRPVLQVTTVGGIPTAVQFYYHPEDIATGIAASANRSQVHVWPDPARDVLHLEGSPTGSLDILSVDGRLIRNVDMGSAPGQAIDVSSLAPGTYILRSAKTGIATRFAVAR